MRAFDSLKKYIITIVESFLFSFFSMFPLKNKVVATTMRGRKFADNTKSIVTSIHDLCPEVQIIWLYNPLYEVEVPNWIKKVKYYGSRLSLIYHLSTAKVWINTHRYESNWKKRKGQLIIQTWHGGLGIKKIEKDTEQVLNSKFDLAEINNTCAISDVFISQSDHLTQIYRRAFGYNGAVYKCGYPKNDIFFTDNAPLKKKVRTYFGVETKIALYAPTFRDNDQRGELDLSPYLFEFQKVVDAIKEKFGGEWTFLIKWHPVMIPYVKNLEYPLGVIDATMYPDMQELLVSCDLLVSDYSSCIFDAMLNETPCFIYAKDFESYARDRGVYFGLKDLPFPYGKTIEQLCEAILSYSQIDYVKSLKAFSSRVGLYESGHASKDIAEKVVSYVKGKTIDWNN